MHFGKGLLHALEGLAKGKMMPHSQGQSSGSNGGDQAEDSCT